MGYRDLERLNLAALLHDIGKVHANDSASAEHAEAGAAIVADIDFLAEHAEIIRRHHEDYVPGANDGVTRLAQVVRVASVYDSRMAVGGVEPQAVVDEIRSSSDRSYDPAVVRALETLVVDSR